MPELFDVASFNMEKASAVVVTSESDASPDTVVTMTTPSLPAGTYTINYSFQVTFTNKNQPGYFKTSGTYGDAAFFSISASDLDELHKNRLYGYPKVHAGGPITMSLDFYKAAGTALTVDFADVAISRVA